MALQLKKYRVKAGLTQAELAKAVGVSQPNYHRWESGAAPIPEDKLKKLSHVFQADTDEIMGRHAPIIASLYDINADEEHSYYGEVAVHFRGGGQSLLISISEAAFSSLHSDLQYNHSFISFESLSNQTVTIRTEAISDLYFSSEAYDDFGPEHGDYKGYVELKMPDSRDWEIVEAIASDDNCLDEFSPEDVERVSSYVMITDRQYDELVAAGQIKLEDLEAEKASNQKLTDRLFNLATQVTYQLSCGRQRVIEYMDPRDLFEAFEPLMDSDVTAILEQSLIHIPIEGPHRIAFLNPLTLDYIITPTHRLKQGQLEVEAETLDS